MQEARNKLTFPGARETKADVHMFIQSIKWGREN